VKAEDTIANGVVGDSKPLELTLAFQPGFDKVALQVAAWFKGVSEQCPSDSSVTTAYSAQLMGGPDEFRGSFRVDSKCHRNQYGPVPDLAR
jgi:hypothetical protein